MAVKKKAVKKSANKKLSKKKALKKPAKGKSSKKKAGAKKDSTKITRGDKYCLLKLVHALANDEIKLSSFDTKKRLEKVLNKYGIKDKKKRELIIKKNRVKLIQEITKEIAELFGDEALMW